MKKLLITAVLLLPVPALSSVTVSKMQLCTDLYSLYTSAEFHSLQGMPEDDFIREYHLQDAKEDYSPAFYDFEKKLVDKIFAEHKKSADDQYEMMRKSAKDSSVYLDKCYDNLKNTDNVIFD